MPTELILVDRVGKKFHRSLSGAFRHRLQAWLRKALRLKQPEALGKDEFWALRDISFMVKRGECLGIIGPNGAGKSTLLKLIQREFRPDSGRVLALGRVQALIHRGAGLQDLLSGRENILMLCQQLGLNPREAALRLADIVAFAGLEQAIDAPVKTYSDGMCARLEFAIATSVPADVFLVDEVLAVGDIAFQIRALDRLNQLKRSGAAIVFVSHSEMNVLHVADRCLLLFDGRQIALGEPDALFSKYYESVGYLNRRLLPLGVAGQALPDIAGAVAVRRLRAESQSVTAIQLNRSPSPPAPLPAGERGAKPIPAEGGGVREGGFQQRESTNITEENSVRTGGSLCLVLEYEAEHEIADAVLRVQFWNAADVLVASVDSGLMHKRFRLAAGRGEIGLRIPFFALTPGCYRLAAGFTVGGQWLAYRGRLLEIVAVGDEMAVYGGLAAMEAVFDGGDLIGDR